MSKRHAMYAAHPRWRKRLPQFPQSLLALLLVCVASCTRTDDQLVLSGPTMGTTYSVKIVRPPADVTANRVRMAIDEELSVVDEVMSTYRDDSEISEFNAAQTTDWVAVSPDLAIVIAAARKVSAMSAGAFDVTVAPLVRLWGFGAGGEAPVQRPSAQAIQEVRDRIGYEHLEVHVQPAALRKHLPALTVDLNGIAPGFAVDRLAQRFDALGLQHYMIEIGGEVRTKGHNAEDESWRIAVEDPLNTAAEPFAILGLTDLSVTTSGEYRHFYALDGRRYSHTIDPRSGEPVAHDLASVVVVSSTSMLADALATAFNVLGATEGYALAERHSIAAMFIRKEGGRLVPLVTPEFRPYLAAGVQD